MADRKKELKKANDAVQAKKNEAPTNAAEAAQNVMNQTTGLGRLKAMQDPNYEVGSYSKSLFGISSLGGGASKIAETGMGGVDPTNAAEATQNVMNQTTGLGRLKAMQDPNYEVGSYSKSLFGISSLGGGASKIAETGMGGVDPTNAAEATQNVMNQTTGLGRLKAMQDPNYEVGSYSKSLFGTSSLGGDLLSNVKSDLRKKTAKPVAKF